MDPYTNPLTCMDACRIINALPHPRRNTYLTIARDNAETEKKLLYWRPNYIYGTDI